MIAARRCAGPWGAMALVALGGAVGLACQTDTHPATCGFQEQVAQAGTPLTLLPDARLDKVGSGFMLIGYDSASRLVRWATVDNGGSLGTQQSAAVPASVAGPWFAAAGRSGPGDTILIAYGTAPSSMPGMQPGMIDVQVLAAPAAGGTPVTAGTLATLPAPPASSADSGPVVVMGSGALGTRAALAWSVPARGEVDVQSIGGDGHAQGQPLVQSATSTTPQISCLSFVTGKDDLAVGYLSQSSNADPNPTWTILEVRADGALDRSEALRLGTVNPTCPLSAVTTTGYATAWQNQLGSWIGVSDRTSSNPPSSDMFAGAVTFGGADVQPPLAGLAVVAGGEFAVVLARPGAAEVWRVGPTGRIGTDAVVLPSAIGQMGAVSTVSSAGSLYATYTDCSSIPNPSCTDGQRFFLKIACF